MPLFDLSFSLFKYSQQCSLLFHVLSSTVAFCYAVSLLNIAASMHAMADASLFFLFHGISLPVVTASFFLLFYDCLAPSYSSARLDALAAISPVGRRCSRETRADDAVMQRSIILLYCSYSRRLAWRTIAPQVEDHRPSRRLQMTAALLWKSSPSTPLCVRAVDFGNRSVADTRSGFFYSIKRFFITVTV